MKFAVDCRSDVMGIESERTALSIESIPKSVSEVQMDQSMEAGNNENPEPPELKNQPKLNEKNGNLDNTFNQVDSTMYHNLIRIVLLLTRFPLNCVTKDAPFNGLLVVHFNLQLTRF